MMLVKGGVKFILFEGEYVFIIGNIVWFLFKYKSLRIIKFRIRFKSSMGFR